MGCQQNHSACLKCHGLLVEFSVRRLRMWRCVSCGDRFDETVLRNRALSKSAQHCASLQAADLPLRDPEEEMGMCDEPLR